MIRATIETLVTMIVLLLITVVVEFYAAPKDLLAGKKVGEFIHYDAAPPSTRPEMKKYEVPHKYPEE